VQTWRSTEELSTTFLDEVLDAHEPDAVGPVSWPTDVVIEAGGMKSLANTMFA